MRTRKLPSSSRSSRSRRWLPRTGFPATATARTQASPGSKFRKPSPARVKARNAARKAAGPGPRHRRVAQGHRRAQADGARAIRHGARARGNSAGGRGPPHPIRTRLDRGVHRPPRRQTQREDRRCNQVVPTQPQIPGNWRTQHPAARAAGHGRQGASDPGRLDHGGRSGHRRKAWPAGQTGPEPDPEQTSTRWSSAQGQVQVETFRIREPGLALAAVFEQQTRRRPTQGRDQRAQRSLVRPVRDAGAEEIPRARRHPGRRGARHDGAARPVNRNHHGPGGRRHVERVHRISRRHRRGAGRRAAAQAQRRVRHRHRGKRGRPHPDRPAVDRGLQRDRGQRLRQCRPAGGGPRPPTSRSFASMARRTWCAGGAGDRQRPRARRRAGRHCRSAEPGRRQRDLDRDRATARQRARPAAADSASPAAAALDRENRFLGMVQLRPQVVANIGTPTLQSQANIVPAQTIRAFLESRELKPASGQSGVEAAKASLVRVICVRK